MREPNHYESNNKGGKMSWPLLYCLTAFTLSLAMLLLLSSQLISGADCLTQQGTLSSNTNNSSNSFLNNNNFPNLSQQDRMVVVKSTAPLSHLPNNQHKKSKETFKETLNEKLDVYVKENTPIGSRITDIQAENPLETHTHTQITYAIISGIDQDSFSLRSDSQGLGKVELINEVNFDYESPKKIFQLRIRATSTYLRYEVDVTIRVTDENDNKPQFDDFTIVFNNYKNNFPTGPIGQVPASDADSSDQLRYRVLTGNKAQLVVVNETNGDIQLNPWLNGNVFIKALIMLAVSDGFNEAVAEMTLIVNLVTESMLQNSVVLRLDGININEFLNTKYLTFSNHMARILMPNVPNYRSTNIVIFDVDDPNTPNDLSTQSPGYKTTNGLYRLINTNAANSVAGDTTGNTNTNGITNSNNNTQSINISFSARANGNDIESYLSSQYIEERVHMNRLTIGSSLGVTVAPFQDNLCLMEPCQNYQECQATYKFDRASRSFIRRGNSFFRHIRATQSYLCNCPSTFTGMKHKSECNLQINQCVLSPCLNDGICHMHENGFTCQCKPGFIGSRCEHSFANSTCQTLLTQSNGQLESSDQLGHSLNHLTPPTCSGTSKCANLNNFYFNANTPSGFTCQGCPHTQWSTDLCQLKARSFIRNSYITLPSLRRRHRFHLMLKFSTFETDALLLYNGRYNDMHDFIALEIVSSYVKFSFSLGSSNITSITLPSISVSNGNWHTVTIDYKDRNVTMLLDDCDPIIDEGLARLQGSQGLRRCSNTSYPDQSITDRTLDLTSPLQLGALLSLRSDNPFNKHDFVGCMSDFHIDHQLIDLYNPILESKTQPGCEEKRNFCHQHSCNVHPCHDTWGAAKCSCGEDTVGRSCEISISNEKVRRFNGNSYLTFNPIDSIVRQNFQVSFHFRTMNPNGILMKILLDLDIQIQIELLNGGLKISYRGQSLSFNKLTLDDGEWHFIDFNWYGDLAQLQIDYNHHLAIQSSDFGSIVGSTIKMITMGSSQTARSASDGMSTDIPPEIVSGVPNLQAEDYLSVFSPSIATTTNGSQNFVGCVYGVNISDNSDIWLSPFEERNVERGCSFPDPCETNSCPSTSRCVRRGINQRKCICLPGFVGDRCLSICDLNPCQGNNSHCIPPVPVETPVAPSMKENLASTIVDLQNTATDYRCECETFRSGKNCEHQLQQRCPSNWWGRPQPGSNFSICNRCNCDESKGFDGDCDKETGQCLCKQDHYQPLGSDQCLPCDCYQDGSLRSRACHQRTGQCKCRPGVVGRRCDACSVAFAQVTVRGCEVVYDGCPKTFSDGVWWEKTLLDKMVTQQCPASTSTGTATRFCHHKEGWLKPNMFDCISNLFSELYNQFMVLEENKFQITTSLAIKIATNLRQALNETASNPNLQLYGSDMFIGFRLIHHLIQHETMQTGMNLTHRQDGSYIRNIVESISYILDPQYAENWPEIAARPPGGGPENLLKLIDNYGKIIIDSQSDFDLQPFEINSKYFTFGLDYIYSWDSMNNNNKLGGILATSPFGSPPYATDPLIGNSQFGIDTTNELLNTNHHSSNFDLATNNRDSTIPSLVIPKSKVTFTVTSPANGLELHSSPNSPAYTIEDTTKILIPFKTLRVKTSTTPDLPPFYQAAKSRAKRSEELIIPDLKYTRRQPALVTYSIFRSLGPLLPSNYDTTVHQGLGSMVVPNSPVVWLTVRPANSSEFSTRNIQPRINYLLKILEPQGKTRPQCAVWDFVNGPTNPTSPSALAHLHRNQTNFQTVQGNTGGFIKHSGRFTTKGCELRGIHHSGKSRLKYDYVNCSCDHLGAVTILMENANYDFLMGDEQNVKNNLIITAICLSLIILSTIYYVLSYVRGHSIKSNSNSINKNLIMILMLIESLILYGYISRTSLSQREYQCKLVAVFLHYFSISLFLWLFVNAVHFYRMLTELRDINHGPMKFYHIMGYAIPAFFVSIAVGLRIEQFGNHLFCWLSTHEPIIWSMFGPIGVTSMATFGLFILALCKSLPVKEDPNGAELLKNHMVINIIKTPLIGVYWLISVYMVNEAFYPDWIYFYPLITILKSIALFGLLCLVDKHIRYNMYVSWLRFRGKEVPFLEDSRNYPSNQWMLSIGAESGSMNNTNKLYPQYGPYSAHQVTTPGFQSPYGDMYQPDILGFSTASTTSRSSITGTSSSAYYQHQHRSNKQDLGNYGRSGRTGVNNKHRRRSKKSSHHKHHHHKHHHKEHHHHHHRSHRHHNEDHYTQSAHYERRRQADLNQNQQQQNDTNNYLASSHSSDNDDASIIPKTTKDYQAMSSMSSKVNSEGNMFEKNQTVPMEVAGPSTVAQSHTDISTNKQETKVVNDPDQANESSSCSQ